ncbi:MAG TPA: hypothetical protein PK285_11540 [Bacteroidales bacterium]|jgi:hypothetical protein|nr:hypothetical protein [Bacteroidales bacterium]
MKRYGFEKGWKQVQLKDVSKIKRELMDAFGINNNVSFLKRLKGDIEPKISQVEEIEKIFHKYGITDIWD